MELHLDFAKPALNSKYFEEKTPPGKIVSLMEVIDVTSASIKLNIIQEGDSLITTAEKI